MNFKNASEINQACSAAYQDALHQAKKDCGRGFYAGRGRWIRVVDGAGNIIAGECDTWEWKGRKADLEAIEKFMSEHPEAVGVEIQGGVNYAESVHEYSNGAYDPFVAEWVVVIYG